MKSIRKHLFLITPIIMVLIGVQIFLILERVSMKYQNNLDDSYSMLLVSNVEQDDQSIIQYVPTLKTIKKLDNNMLMDHIISDLDETNKSEIISLLPNFYSLTFDLSTSHEDMDRFKESLLSDETISRVEIFKSSYIDEYKIFQYTKLAVEAMVLFIMVLSIFVIVQQMKYWNYLYSKHIYIMKVFGATRSQRIGMLFKQLFWDSFLSSLLVSVLFYYIQSLIEYSGISILIENQENIFHPIDIIYIVTAAVILTIISILTINIFNKQA